MGLSDLNRFMGDINDICSIPSSAISKGEPRPIYDKYKKWDN